MPVYPKGNEALPHNKTILKFCVFWNQDKKPLNTSIHPSSQTLWNTKSIIPKQTCKSWNFYLSIMSSPPPNPFTTTDFLKSVRPPKHSHPSIYQTNTPSLQHPNSTSHHHPLNGFSNSLIHHHLMNPSFSQTLFANPKVSFLFFLLLHFIGLFSFLSM